MHQKHRSHVFWWFSGIMMLMGLSLSAQPASNVSFTATNTTNSDYAMTLSWTYNGDYCNCNQSTSLNVTGSQSGGNTPPSGYLGTSIGALTSQYISGPGQSISLDWTFSFSGRRSWAGSGCLAGATCGIADCNCSASFSGTGASSSTAAIKPPTGVNAGDGDYDTKVVITWSHQTNIPHNLHEYRIYANNVYLATVAGTSTSYEHTGLMPGYTATYDVRTYAPASSFGLAHESASATNQGSTFDVGLTVSDGNFINRAKLSWNDIADVCDEIRIERSIPGGGKEEIAILSANATAYNDQDGIPGYNYTYSVTPISSSNLFLTDTDTGYSKPNGKISGHVRSQLNAGVSGVDITVRLITSIPAGGAALPAMCALEYCATTDAEGYYEINDIYYYTSAEFRVIPSKQGLIPHDFTPDSITRSLDQSVKVVSGVDFTDLTVYTVGGRVHYPTSSNGSTCGVEGAKILVDNKDYGILTDSDGDWTFAIQEDGNYSFQAVYYHHVFESASGEPIDTIHITSDYSNIDFEDVETDDLRIVVQAGCEASLGDSVQVRVTAPDNCFDKFYFTDANGLLTIHNLPAREYSVQVTDILPHAANYSNIMDQIGNQPIDIDLTVRDTAEHVTETDTIIITPLSKDTLPNNVIITIPADTVETTLYDTSYSDVPPSVIFIYRSPLVLQTTFEGAEVMDNCTNSAGENIILMEQGLSYTVSIDVKEVLGDCYIDTGFLKIYDFVSDRGEQAIKVPIIGGVATYVIEAGEPIIASSSVHDHEKLFYIIPEVDLLEAEPVEYWIMVEGAKSNTPTFITRTPDIPMVILHDPPGDGSSSFIEKGTSFTSFTTSEVQVGGEAGFYMNLLLGAKFKTPFSGHGFGTQIKLSAVGGRDNFDRNGIYTTVTFNERFSTSEIENLTGHDGDVYVGAAFNQEFSLAELLEFNPDSCKAFVDIIPSMAVTDFATTFVYTEKHVKNTLLPTIGFIKDNILDGRAFNTLTLQEQTEVNNLIADSISWTNILNKNRIARDSAAIFKENISFSAGAPISRDYTDETVTMVSYEYNRFMNTEFGLGAKIDNEGGIWFDSELGIMGKFRYSSSVNEGDDTTVTRTVGYIFDDNDIGDFFSVDILQDRSYNVPAFKLKVGTTSCPQEPGSQARDRASIEIFPPELLNIPEGEAANFLCRITNLSESFETREYGVRVVGTTNPDGMIVTLAGQWIGSGEGTFFLERGQSSNLVLSFDQGPLASTYENIGVMIYPTCEYPLWQDNGNLTNSDTAWIKRIEWQTSCTDVALHRPEDGWLINKQSNGTLHAAFTGYDINNELFESLTLQIKKEGEGYTNLETVNKDELIGAFHDVFIDMSNFPNGDYRLRAVASCGLDGTTYSSEKLGTIDTSSIAPFGIPTPSDGFLREGQEVSVAFDKLIKCPVSAYPHEITLTRGDNGASIPFTTSCFQNKLIINTTPPLLEQLDLEGVEVHARVHLLQDLNGNVQEYPTEWSFLVNVSPVFWDPENLTATGYEGQENIVRATLKNTSLLSKPFSLEAADNAAIIQYPDWLTPLQTRGTILPENDYEVQFAVDPGLSPGIYSGEIVAMVDSLPVSMNLTYELLAIPVTWPFNPDEYQYSMTVVAQFSLDAGNVNLSTDTRDLVGAFVNGQIRGVTNMVYIPQLNVYRAFLTVYSNVQGGGGAETVSFRFWRALTGVEYSALETTPFTLDAAVGSVTTPFILHPRGFLQEIPLNKGWNWISLNLTNPNMSKETIFQNLLNSVADNTITIKSKSQTTSYSPQSGWSGNLANLQLGAGYLIELSNGPDTLRVPGLPSASTISVAVSGNWNWIGFPRLAPEPVNLVLSDLTNAVTGNILKSQTQFSSYHQPSASWLGNLSFFNPGEGYKLNLTNAGNIFFDPSRSDGFETDPYLYEYNMNINGSADLSIIGESNQADMIVGAFIGDTCRGTGTFEYNEILGEWRIVMLVNGNVEDLDKPVEFRFLNESSGRQYMANGEPLKFIADGIIGTIEDPYPFFSMSTAVEDVSTDGYYLEQSIPNPAKDKVQIGYHVPVSTDVTLTVFDANGEIVMQPVNEHADAGRHVIYLNVASLPQGIYFYELKTNDFTAAKKMVRQ